MARQRDGGGERRELQRIQRRMSVFGARQRAMHTALLRARRELRAMHAVPALRQCAEIVWPVVVEDYTRKLDELEREHEQIGTMIVRARLRAPRCTGRVGLTAPPRLRLARPRERRSTRRARGSTASGSDCGPDG